MAVLKIHSAIMDDEERSLVEFFGGTGFSYSTLDEFLDSMDAGDGEIEVRLHCPGGSVSEGWAIIDRLRATGKTVSAVVEGACASMASVILLAASVRRGAPHATLLIHDPFIPENSLLESYRAEDLARLAGELSAERERILDFYAERTGADRAELDAQMREGTAMTMERARELGFIQEILPPISASAAGGRTDGKAFNNDTIMKRTIIDEIKALLSKYGSGEPRTVNYDLNTADGGTISIDKPEGEEPAVGDSASPDGEWLMPDGSTIVIAGGAIAEIRPAEEETAPEEETEALKERVSKLEEELEAMRAERDAARTMAKSAEDMEILNLVRIAGGKDWLARAKSGYRPAAREVKKAAEPAPANPIAEALAEARRRNGLRAAGGTDVKS